MARKIKKKKIRPLQEDHSFQSDQVLHGSSPKHGRVSVNSPSQKCVSHFLYLRSVPLPQDDEQTDHSDQMDHTVKFF